MFFKFRFGGFGDLGDYSPAAPLPWLRPWVFILSQVGTSIAVFCYKKYLEHLSAAFLVFWGPLLNPGIVESL
jgi:hypothetical protein